MPIYQTFTLLPIDTIYILPQTPKVHDPSILTIPNATNKTPTDLAILCEGNREIQTRFTIVLFNHYQVPRPLHPLFKSPSCEVHECWDLRAARDGNGTYKRLVLKLIRDPHMWTRELEVRCAFFDGNLHSRMPLVPTPARLKRAGV
jgi:hypothetical protein